MFFDVFFNQELFYCATDAIRVITNEPFSTMVEWRRVNQRFYPTASSSPWLLFFFFNLLLFQFREFQFLCQQNTTKYTAWHSCLSVPLVLNSFMKRSRRGHWCPRNNFTRAVIESGRCNEFNHFFFLPHLLTSLGCEAVFTWFKDSAWKVAFSMLPISARFKERC